MFSDWCLAERGGFEPALYRMDTGIHKECCDIAAISSFISGFSPFSSKNNSKDELQMINDAYNYNSPH